MHAYARNRGEGGRHAHMQPRQGAGEEPVLFALLRLPTHPSCTRTIVMHGRCMRCIGLPRRAGHGLCLGPRRPAALQLHCACLCCLGRGCEPPTCPVHARWWRQFSAPNKYRNLPRRQTSLFYSPCNDAIVSYLQLLGLQQLLSVWLSSLPRHLLVGPSLLLGGLGANGWGKCSGRAQ